MSNPYTTGDTHYRRHVTVQILRQVEQGVPLPELKIDERFTVSEIELIYKHAKRCNYNIHLQGGLGRKLNFSNRAHKCSGCAGSILPSEAHFIGPSDHVCINCSDWLN